MEAMYEGFGVPADAGHYFYVAVPKGPDGYASVYERCGGDSGSKGTALRARIPGAVWDAVKDSVEDHFNARLKDRGLPSFSWSDAGKARRVKLDIFFGRELCVLFWTLQVAIAGEVEGICEGWKRYRPEERWWMFTKMVQPVRSRHGLWQKILYGMLSDGSRLKLQGWKKARPPWTEGSAESLSEEDGEDAAEDVSRPVPEEGGRPASGGLPEWKPVLDKAQ